MQFMEETFIPLAAKIGSQRHLVAIRDAFVITMPLTIVGAIGVLLNNIQGIFGPTGLNMVGIQQGYTNFIKSTGLSNVFSAANRGTISMLAILVTVCLGYNMAIGLGKDKDAMACGVVCMAVYIGITPAMQTVTNFTDFSEGATLQASDVAGGGIAGNKLDSNGLFVAMIFAMITSEVFIRLGKNEKLRITLPDGVPPAVANSFTVLIPAMITCFAIMAIGTYIDFATGNNVWYWIQKFIGAPLEGVTDSLGATVLIMFMINLLWIFGLHGANIVGSVTSPIETKLLNDNTNYYNAHGIFFNTHADDPALPTHIYNKVFRTVYGTMGGSGATMGLIIAILLFGKVEAEKTVIGISVAPGLFEINEPITFGIPIVMNPIYMWPFIIGPIVCDIIGYMAVKLSLVEVPAISIPWVTPPVLSMFLGTGGGIRATILQVLLIALLAAIWTPFVMMSNKMNG